MKRGLVLLFVLLFSVSFVFAQNGWGDINVDDGEGNESDVEKDVSGEDVVSSVSDEGSSDSSVRYTRDFYIALGVAGVGVLIAVFFVYLFLRKPRERWKKR